MAIQGVLKRKVNGELTDTYLKTSANLVAFDDSSTVLDRLSYCLDQIAELNLSSGNVDTKIQTAIDSLYTELAGVSDASELSGDAYNTIKKISTALKTNTGNIADMKTTLDTVVKDLESYVKASDLSIVATSGKYSDLIGAPEVKEYSNATTSADGLMSSTDKAKLDGVQENATKVEASETNGNIKINGIETTVYTGSNITKADIGLENVGNFKAVSTEANQGLSTSEQKNARDNIGASAFSGSYDDLTDKPVNATSASDGFMSSTDKAKLDGIQDNATKVEASDTNGNIKINGVETQVYTASAISASDIGLDKVGNFKAVSTEASQGLSLDEQQNARDNIGAASSVDLFDGDYNNLTNKPTNATTSTDGFMSKEDKNTLDSLSSNAITSITKSSTNGNISVNGEDIEVYVAPELATVATTGNYADLIGTPTEATTESSGLMSATDKEKLDGLSGDASKTVVEASETNGNIKVDGTEVTVYTPPELATVATSGSYNDLTDKPSTATTTANGFMSYADKNKLDNIHSNATEVRQSTTNGNILVDGEEVQVYATEDIPEATQSSAGLMSAADKTKLDGLSDTGGIIEGTVGELKTLRFSSSTYYSISKGYYRCSDGICVVTGLVTCNKLVVPAADTVLNTGMPAAAVSQKVDITPHGETSYPPIQITMGTDGTLAIQGGASGCTYNVQFMYIATVDTSS